MPSAAATGSMVPGGNPFSAASIASMLSITVGRIGPGSGRPRSRAHLHSVDLALELHDAVDQRLGAGRAAGREPGDRDDLVDALHQRVVVEDAADRGAGPHRDHVLRLWHLV